MKISILLADDHSVLREALRTALEEQPDLGVVGEAGDGRTAVEMAQALSPDVVVMDISMPELNGVEATRQILGLARGARVIALSMHSDRRYVTKMLEAGAVGYLLKSDTVAELVRAVREAMAERTYLSPKIARDVLDHYVRNPALAQGAAAGERQISDREREVLQLLAEGKSSKEMASILQLSVKTIETHRNRIMRKLSIHTIAELTKYAVREGLTSLE
jgi:DNA-binding NarL/FixJ family response regulator